MNLHFQDMTNEEYDRRLKMLTQIELRAERAMAQDAFAQAIAHYRMAESNSDITQETQDAWTQYEFVENRIAQIGHEEWVRNNMFYVKRQVKVDDSIYKEMAHVQRI